MPSSASFRRQHQDLLTIAQELSTTLNAASLAQDANKTRTLLTKLIGELGVHLAMEDKVLYPTLAKSSDPLVRDTSTRFAKEMGGIGEVVASYKTQWPTAARIQAEPQKFIDQTNGILQALGQRIEKENTELYPLFDKS